MAAVQNRGIRQMFDASLIRISVLFPLLQVTLAGCAISPTAPSPALPGQDFRARTTLGVAQRHDQIPFVFCDQCPERTQKLVSLPTAVPVVARAMPEAPPIKRTQRWALHFGLGSSRLGKRSLDMLNEIASALNAHPSARVSIEGHTDLLGSPRFNRRLAKARARAVRDALFGLGVSRARIGRLAADCCIEHPPTANPGARRVDILVRPVGELYVK